MTGGVRRVAIIPARGGSKRIPGKNIAVVGDKPIIHHTIAAVDGSGLFDVVHVSTDSAVIARVAADAGRPVEFLRPPELADDLTGLNPVLVWVLEELDRRGSSFDVACLVLATAALVTPDDLRRGASVHESDAARRAVLAVARYPAPVEWAFDIDGAGVLRRRDPIAHTRRSQDLQPAFYDTGTFMFFDPLKMIAGTYADDGFLPVELDPWKGIDVDEPADLRLVELLLAAGAGKP